MRVFIFISGGASPGQLEQYLLKQHATAREYNQGSRDRSENKGKFNEI